MATKGRKRVAVLMAVLPLVAATRLPALSGGTQFRVKYEVGTPAIKQGAPVRVKFEPRFIICEAKKGLSFSIPTAGITEVGHDSIPWSRSKALLRKGLYGYGQGIGALYDMALLAVAGALLPFGGEDHFVHIAWNWDGSDEVVWFELSKDRYAAFLQELERATGKKALDLSTEREEKQHELLDKAETVEIRLDRKVWVAGKTLKPGRYQLVLLERNETTGELYFFRSKKAKPKHPETGAVVEIVRRTSKISSPKVIFDRYDISFPYPPGSGGSRDPPTAVDIQLPTKILRIQ